jgi:hypothetical protein
VTEPVDCAEIPVKRYRVIVSFWNPLVSIASKFPTATEVPSKTPSLSVTVKVTVHVTKSVEDAEDRLILALNRGNAMIYPFFRTRCRR